MTEKFCELRISSLVGGCEGVDFSICKKLIHYLALSPRILKVHFA